MNVLVSDENDSPPVFPAEPYSFRVREGAVGLSVGKIAAADADEGANAAVAYSVADELFSVDAGSGEIRTRKELDFEKQQVHYLVVTAKDKDEKHAATATVTVLVQDVSDEVRKLKNFYFNINHNTILSKEVYVYCDIFISVYVILE